MAPGGYRVVSDPLDFWAQFFGLALLILSI
jgi:hypothetical protein